ncbi:MAG: hypothetical protein J3Q66DRAFT_268320, partial [Benniella sp.]
SDNGKGFKNDCIKAVTTVDEIKHMFRSPYHPRANRLAERNVRKAKAMIDKLIE